MSDNEASLRIAKDEITAGTMEQARRMGIEPTSAPAEEFAKSIVEKTAKRLANGDGIGPPRAQAQQLPEQPVGEYEWDLKTDELRPIGDAFMPPKESLLASRMRLFVRWLLRCQPEYKAQISRLALQYHALLIEKRDTAPVEKAIRRLVAKAIRHFGDPRNPDLLAPKISVHG